MGAIIGLVILFAISGVIYFVKTKVNEKLEQHVFSRAEYKGQLGLINKKFHYYINAPASSIRSALDTYVLGASADFTGLSIASEGPDYVTYGFRTLHLNFGGVASALGDIGAGQYEFQGAVTLTPGDIIFTFLRWKTADGVVRNLDEMQKLKDRVDMAMNSLAPGAQAIETA